MLILWLLLIQENIYRSKGLSNSEYRVLYRLNKNNVEWCAQYFLDDEFESRSVVLTTIEKMGFFPVTSTSLDSKMAWMRTLKCTKQQVSLTVAAVKGKKKYKGNKSTTFLPVSVWLIAHTFLLLNQPYMCM